MTSPPVPEIHESPSHPLTDWFDHHRFNRQSSRNALDPRAGAKRSRAVLTMARNESFLLPVFLRYYSRFFAPEDIYVIDHDSDDGSTGGDGFQLIEVHQPEFDNVWQRETVEAHHRELLERYDLVIYVDVDELVVPRPSMGDLGDYLDAFNEPFVNCLGYEILHLPDREPPLDPGLPISEQRGYWFPCALYNKIGVASEPVVWTPGFHTRADRQLKPDPDLFMVHLHRVDYEQCLARHRSRVENGWSERRVREGWGAYNRITEADEFRDWFFTYTGIPDYPLRLEPIGPEWKGAF